MDAQLKDVTLRYESAAVTVVNGRPLGGPADFVFRYDANDLLTYVYCDLAEKINTKVALSECLECGEAFRITNRRQRYCTPAHSVRARNRRRHESQVAAAS